MKIKWTKKAESNLSKIFEHTLENFSFEKAQGVFLIIREASSRLSEYPEMGRKIGNHFHKRYLIAEGNVLVYEILLEKDSCIVIRNIRPRKTK